MQGEQVFDKVNQLKPDYAEAYSKRGNALTDLERLEQAVASYNPAIQVQPGFAGAHSNLIFTQDFLST